MSQILVDGTDSHGRPVGPCLTGEDLGIDSRQATRKPRVAAAPRASGFRLVENRVFSRTDLPLCEVHLEEWLSKRIRLNRAKR